MNQCQKCQRVLPPDAKNGICPSCVLGLARGNAPFNEPTRAKAADLESFPSPQELNQLLPNYRVDRLIGQGGMGAVYLAHQPSLDRQVAIKIMSHRFAHDPSFAERFSREARTMAKLNHQHIVNVYDYGRAGNSCYLVMEYVEGVNLRQAMREGTLTAEQGLAIVPQVCEALQFAHDEGIIHRDIKPENILVDKKGRVKIADFGLAKLIDEDQPSFTLTGSRQVLGTLNYMAPEQIERPTTVDHRADIYSLGVVLYELLTGELPLGRFQLPGEKFAGHAALDNVVVRTLEKQPDRRFQQASEVRSAVEMARSNPSFQNQHQLAPPQPEAPKAPRDKLVNSPAPPLKSDRPNSRNVPRVKFEIENPWHGMTVTKGLISVQTDGISINYSKRENVFNSTMFGESGTHLIPFDLVHKVELKEGWFSHSIVLKLDTLDDYAALFAEEPGTLVFTIKAADEDEVREVVDAIRARKGQPPLPYLSSKPEDKRGRAQRRMMWPAIGLLLAGIINTAVLPLVLAIGYFSGDSPPGRNSNPRVESALELLKSVSEPRGIATAPAVDSETLDPEPALENSPANTGQMAEVAVAPSLAIPPGTDIQPVDEGQPNPETSPDKPEKTKQANAGTNQAQSPMNKIRLGFWRLEFSKNPDVLAWNLVLGGLFTFVGLIICTGGFGMMLLRNWGWCLAMSIVALIPFHPGSVIGIPAGICALIQLNRECNRSQFEQT